MLPVLMVRGAGCRTGDVLRPVVLIELLGRAPPGKNADSIRTLVLTWNHASSASTSHTRQRYSYYA